MARGYYELPHGYSKPTYGPRRPPAPPTAATPAMKASRLSSTQPSRHLHAQSLQPRLLIVALSQTSSIEDTMQTIKLREMVNSYASVEEIGNMDEAIAALSRRPSAVLANKMTLTEPSCEPFRLAVARYVQNGGTLATEPSHLSALMERVRGT